MYDTAWSSPGPTTQSTPFSSSCRDATLRVCVCPYPSVSLAYTGLHFPLRVQHVLLREQDDSALGALQPHSQKGGAVARIGEKITTRDELDRTASVRGVSCSSARRWIHIFVDFFERWLSCTIIIHTSSIMMAASPQRKGDTWRWPWFTAAAAAGTTGLGLAAACGTCPPPACSKHSTSPDARPKLPMGLST